MQREHSRVPIALAPIELAPREGRRGGRIVQLRRAFRRGEAPELLQEIAAPAPHERRQLRPVVGEIQKGRRGSEFLPLKKHGCLR